MIQQMTSTGLFNNSMAPNQAQHTSQASPQAHHTSHNQPTVATFSPRPSPITSIETLTSSSQTITPFTSLEPPPSTSPTPDSPIHPNPLQLIPCSHDPKTTLPNLSFQLTAQSVILFQRHWSLSPLTSQITMNPLASPLLPKTPNGTKPWTLSLMHFSKIKLGLLFLQTWITMLLGANGCSESSAMLMDQLSAIKQGLWPRDFINNQGSIMTKPTALS